MSNYYAEMNSEANARHDAAAERFATSTEEARGEAQSAESELELVGAAYEAGRSASYHAVDGDNPESICPEMDTDTKDAWLEGWYAQEEEMMDDEADATFDVWGDDLF